jgi:hypothetical protein
MEPLAPSLVGCNISTTSRSRIHASQETLSSLVNTPRLMLQWCAQTSGKQPLQPATRGAIRSSPTHHSSARASMGAHGPHAQSVELAGASVQETAPMPTATHPRLAQASGSTRPPSPRQKKVYFYAEFNPVANGQQCNKGLKSNASLGASTPPVPIAIQLAYHVKPGWMVVPGSADTALSGPYDYTGAADTCMENGDACESFSFECSNAPNGCGICAGGPRDQCEEKFPQEATQITYTHFGQSSLVKDANANHAAYWKTGRRFVVPNPPSQKSNVTSVMV